MKRVAVEFTGVKQVRVVTEPIPPAESGQVWVRTRCSAISAGSEKLVYRGLLPEGINRDETIPALAGKFTYPFRYGYCCVGEVVAAGERVDQEWLGKRVFAFNPHESAFVSNISDLIPLPDDLSDEDGVFLANMETAVNLVQDAAPQIGEAVIVFGLGVVGLLTLAVLHRYPLGHIVAVETLEKRRMEAAALGISQSLDAANMDAKGIRRKMAANGFPSRGADLAFELSGAPVALSLAIQSCGFGGRVVVGSWYGSQPVQLNLGDHFHRNRLRLISSQVSTLSPTLNAGWDKARRMDVALDLLRKIKPSRWISHRYPVEQAAEAYRLLDEQPAEVIQVLLDHSQVL